MPKNLTVLLTSFLVFTSFLPVTAAGGQALPAPVTMLAAPAIEGYFKYGEWMVIWVELENSGSDLRANLEVRVPGSSGTVIYAAPIDLPSGSRKRVPIYVLPNNFSRVLNLQLLSQAELISETNVPVNPQLNNAYLVGLLTGERGGLSQVNGASLPPGHARQLLLVDLSGEQFPEKAAVLKSLDTLVINDVDTSLLNAQQIGAIEAWVRQGGTLVVGGGSGTQKSLSGLPETLVPFKFDDQVELQNLPSLVSFSATQNTEDEGPPIEDAIRVPGPFLVATGEAAGDRILLQENELPLLVQKKVGNGTVYFVALDLASSPFDGWKGTVHFWENLLSPGAAYPDWIPPDVSNRQQLAGQMPYTLTNLPMLDLPSVRLLAVWLLIYIVIIGPVNYLILRWKKRLHLAWITIPAITLIFSIGAFGLGYALRGTDVFVNKISVIEMIPDGQAQVTSFFGVFSPAQRVYEIDVAGNGLISAMSPFYNPWDSAVPTGSSSGRELRLVQGDPAIVQGLSIEQWSMHSFMVEGIAAEMGGIDYSLQYRDQKLVGTIRNNTGQTIKDALVFINKSIYRLGDMIPAQVIQVEFAVADQSGMDGGPSLSYVMFQDQLNQPNASGPPIREAEVKRQVVEALFERTPAYQFSSSKSGSTGAGMKSTPVFLGWIDEAPPVVKVRNTEPGTQTTAVLMMPLTFTLPAGEVVVPAGWLPGQLVQSPVDGGTCGEPGTASVYLNRGSGVFKFDVPPHLRAVNAGKLRLSIWNDSGSPLISPEIALFDQVSQTWTTLNGIQAGVNLVPQAAQFINPAGEVMLRISPAENSQGCYFLAMGLEGVAP